MALGQLPKPIDPKFFEGACSDDVHRKSEDKVAIIMPYCKAKGLCFKCGGKWGPQHKCHAYVPLNMVEEVWKLVVEPVCSQIPPQ